MSDGQAAFQGLVSDECESLLNLFSDCGLSRRMHLESTNAGSSGQREAKHVRKVHVERQKHSIFCYRKSPDLFVRRSREPNFENCDRVMALLTSVAPC